MKNNYIFFLFAFIMFVSIHFGFSQTVKQWSVFEKSLTSTNAYTNSDKYKLSLTATFTGPGGISMTVPGFWDGSTTWKIRFSPTVAGTWSYTISSTDNQLNNTSNNGSFSCVAVTSTDIADNPNNRGFLKTSSNNRYLTYADGTKFYWLGCTVWDGNSKNMGINGDYLTYLNDRKNKNFTVIQFLVWESNVGAPRWTGTNEAGNMFVSTWNEINVAAAQNLEKRIKHIVDRGMVPCVFFHWGRELNASNNQRNPYYRHLVARLQAYNVIWCISGEYDYGNKDNARSAGNHVNSIDGSNHLITIHPGPNEGNWSSIEDFQNESWLDFHMLQVWWQDIGQHSLNNYNILKNTGPKKPLLFSEGNYDDPNADQSRERRPAWQTVLNGCFGFSYGCFHVWNWNEGGSGLNALNIAGARQTVYMGNFMRTIDWTKLNPGRDQGICGTKNCAFSDEDIIVFYEGGGTATVKTSSLSGTATVRWLNAVNGTWNDQGSVTVGGNLSFSSPFGSTDAVLHLQTGGVTIVEKQSAGQKHGLKVYPNPLKGGTLTIELGEPAYGHLSISDIQGRVVIRQELSGVQLINLTDIELAKGVYLIMCQNGRKVLTSHIVVE